jgi:hypothetical protein
VPHVVARLRLDLDDRRAEQGELVRPERSREITGEVEDADAGKGLGHRLTKEIGQGAAM